MRKFIVDHLIELAKNKLLIAMTLPFLVWVASWFSEGLASAAGFSTAIYIAHAAGTAMMRTFEYR